MDAPSPRRRLARSGAGAAERAETLDKVRRRALIALLAWAPLPLGSGRSWAGSLLGVLAAVLLALAGLGEVRRPGGGAPFRQLRWAIILGVVLVGWILLQSLPQSVLYHPLWDEAAEALGSAPAPSISVDRQASLVRLFHLLTYAAVFLLAWQAGRRVEGAALVMRAIMAIGAADALYGMVQYASPTPRILWFRKWAYVHDVTGTFVNRNSFATFAGLALIAGLVPLAQQLKRSAAMHSRAALWFSAAESLLARGRWALAGSLLSGSALLLSHSRGGAMATLCGVLAFVALAMSAPSLRSDWRRPFGWIAGAGLLGGLLLAGGGVLQRAADTSAEADSRWAIFSSTLSAIRDNFLTGTGLGTFRFIFPMYQSPRFEGFVDLAHNDYLENLLELGVPAAALLFVLLGSLVIECLRGVRRRRKDALYPCAAVAASVLVAVHSCFDFSLQIPAVAVTYAAILGVGVAQSVSSRPAEAP